MSNRENKAKGKRKLPTSLLPPGPTARSDRGWPRDGRVSAIPLWGVSTSIAHVGERWPRVMTPLQRCMPTHSAETHVACSQSMQVERPHAEVHGAYSQSMQSDQVRR